MKNKWTGEMGMQQELKAAFVVGEEVGGRGEGQVNIISQV